MARPPREAIPITEPLNIEYGETKVSIQAKFRAPVRGLSNGGARIQVSGVYEDYEAIILITTKKVLK